MYPDFQYLLQSLLGTEMPEWLSIFKTFGFLVALSFLGAGWTLALELKRKEKQGLLQPDFNTVITGKPASITELISSAVIGFIVGFKGGGLLTHAAEAAPNPMGYLFSLKGHFLIGIAGAALLAYSKYAEKKKQQLPEPQEKKIPVHPYQRVTELGILAAISGFAGAKIFNAFETWDDFIANPVANLLSSSGLTFYGGLIVATITLYIYARKHNIGFKYLCDAAAPGLMLAYGLGRLGCQFAGDGDWGIFNSAYVTGETSELHAAAPNEFQAVLHDKSTYFINNFGNLDKVPHISAPAPSWLPDWMFAMNYPHNVNNEGIMIQGCSGYYCSVLPAGVFPTPLYEAFACVALFFLLWSLRKRLKYPLQMFGLYLILNGVERFFIEKIRVNYKYDWGFLHPTQAEIISVVLVLIGTVLIATAKRSQPVATQS